MSCNRLKAIPNEISHLIVLDTLILIDNKIEQIPSGLCDCSNLRVLYLAFNKIRSLPNRLFFLRNLDWNKNGPLAVNCLSGNPIEYPSLDKICSLGLNEIFKFLRENSNECLLGEDENENDYVPANSIDSSLSHEIRIPNALVIDDLDEE